jgi:B9 domain-containing protein 1
MNGQQQPSALNVTVQGTIESCFTPRARDMYVKYGFEHSDDWQLLSGAKAGISCSSRREGLSPAIFNHPIEATFSGPSPYGWPQIVVAVYGLNFFGNDEVVGYGVAHVPLQPGKFELEVPLFAPEPQTLFQRISGFFTGLYPELIHLKTIAGGDERSCLHTCSQGKVKLVVQVVISDWDRLKLHLC